MSAEYSEQGEEGVFDAWIHEAAATYRLPPIALPREEMWGAIVASGATGYPAAVKGAQSPSGRASTSSYSRYGSWRLWAMPIGACALVGIGVIAGRAIRRNWVRNEAAHVVVKAPVTPNRPVAPTEHSAEVLPSGPPMTRSYYADVSNLLATFEGQPPRDSAEVAISAWARDLLSQTQVLLDAPAAQDPRRRKLLLDLELVLVQMVQLSTSHSQEDTQLIERAIRDVQLLPRLRSALPEAGA